MQIDLNSDLGESYGAWQMGNDSLILAVVSRANIACGFHAGDPAGIFKTLKQAAACGVNVGAHVSYPDLVGFGRRNMDMSYDELLTDVMYQVAALQGLAKAAGTQVTYVKPHGALYNTIAHNLQQAKAVIDAMQLLDPKLILVGLAGSALIEFAQQQGVMVIAEAFADRAYNADGSLVSRRLAGAVLHDVEEIAARVVSLIQTGGVTSIDGQFTPIQAQSICLHGDTQGAVEMAQAIRQRLEQLAQKLKAAIGELGYRVFSDSAPVLEKPIAVKAGLGWMGKHTNLLSREAGSWFFLGEIYTDLALPETGSVKAHCGQCQACLEVCPTQAIIAPYQLDARRCISYLTIELNGPIPEELRPLIGNRIYGCDDCQLICPWNRYAVTSPEPDFSPRQSLHTPDLLTLWAWDEAMFLKTTEGSAIRRIGFEKWQRNIAIALGNGPASDDVIHALEYKRAQASPLVQEHIDWALCQLRSLVSSENRKHDKLIRCIYKGLADHA